MDGKKPMNSDDPFIKYLGWYTETFLIYIFNRSRRWTQQWCEWNFQYYSIKHFNEDFVSFYLFCFLTDNSHARINALRFAKDSSIELFELYRLSKNCYCFITEMVIVTVKLSESWSLWDSFKVPWSCRIYHYTIFLCTS